MDAGFPQSRLPLEEIDDAPEIMDHHAGNWPSPDDPVAVPGGGQVADKGGIFNL
jgi:hypothetical protein